MRADATGGAAQARAPSRQQAAQRAPLTRGEWTEQRIIEAAQNPVAPPSWTFDSLKKKPVTPRAQRPSAYIIPRKSLPSAFKSRPTVVMPAAAAGAAPARRLSNETGAGTPAGSPALEGG